MRRPRRSGAHGDARANLGQASACPAVVLWLELCKVAQTSGVGRGPTAQSQS
jgi:hypothetical protein